MTQSQETAGQKADQSGGMQFVPEQQPLVKGADRREGWQVLLGAFQGVDTQQPMVSSS